MVENKNEKRTDLKKLESCVKSVTILGSIIDEITLHSVKAMPNEAIGLLGGNEIRDQELIIKKILFVSVGNEISVSFSENDFTSFEKILDGKCYCLGWWHSHPGYGLFLSQTDISTHIYSFQSHNEQSIALVSEPTEIDTNGRAAFKCYQVVGEEGIAPFKYQEIASYIQ